MQIPEIATFEWHPFTISSAPEKKDYFTLHIRGIGGWTNEVYNYFEQEYRYLSPFGTLEGDLIDRTVFRSQQEGTEQWRRSSIYHLAMSVKNGVQQRMRPSRSGDLSTGDDFDEMLTNEEEIEAISHIRNLRRKPSVVRYGSRGARKLYIYKYKSLKIWKY